MKYAKIKYTDISNGPGVRTTVFFSGCSFKCKGCFNEEAQDFNYGFTWNKEIEDKIIEYSKKDIIKGINILGGEPLQQDWSILSKFLKRLKEETGKPIWLWTGFDSFIVFGTNVMLNILENLEVIVTGQFEIENKSFNLKYRGSTNQEVIDVQKTLATDSDNRKIILWGE